MRTEIISRGLVLKITVASRRAQELGWRCAITIRDRRGNTPIVLPCHTVDDCLDAIHTLVSDEKLSDGELIVQPLPTTTTTTNTHHGN